MTSRSTSQPNDLPATPSELTGEELLRRNQDLRDALQTLVGAVHSEIPVLCAESSARLTHACLTATQASRTT